MSRRNNQPVILKIWPRKSSRKLVCIHWFSRKISIVPHREKFNVFVKFFDKFLASKAYILASSSSNVSGLLVVNTFSISVPYYSKSILINQSETSRSDFSLNFVKNKNWASDSGPSSITLDDFAFPFLTLACRT